MPEAMKKTSDVALQLDPRMAVRISVEGRRRMSSLSASLTTTAICYRVR
jgi:hypothetical protein